MSRTRKISCSIAVLLFCQAQTQFVLEKAELVCHDKNPEQLAVSYLDLVKDSPLNGDFYYHIERANFTFGSLDAVEPDFQNTINNGIAANKGYMCCSLPRIAARKDNRNKEYRLLSKTMDHHTPDCVPLDQEEHPGGRWGHVLIYDETNDNLLLFGGTRERNGEFLSDTWLWKKGRWQKMEGSGPSARGFAAATYHKIRKTIVLHGGRGEGGVVYSDLWEWDGTVWQQIERHSDYSADHHQMVYMAKTNVLLAFGGWGGKEVLGDTWSWSKKWQKLQIFSPPKRASFAMVYDIAGDKAILYGGLWIKGQYADIWEFTNGKWQQCGTAYGNSSLDHYNMIYDQKHQKIIGFGGKDYRYIFQKGTFSIEGERITTLEVIGPSGRHSAGFTYDLKAKCGYLYGGKMYMDGAQVALQDFWQWDGVKWRKM